MRSRYRHRTPKHRSPVVATLVVCLVIVAGLIAIHRDVHHGEASPAGTVATPVARASSDSAGWPDASDTGVPPGTTLTPSGDITVAVAGAVVSGLDIVGCVMIEANDVTLKDSRIRHGNCGDRFNIDTGSGFTGIVIEDVEIDGQNEDTGQDDGIGFAGFSCIRCNIHGVGQGANVTHDVTFRDSWVHDLHYFDGEHIEDVVSNGGSNMTFMHNNFDAPTTPGTSSSLSLYGDFSPIQNVVIKNNMFNGGSYCLYAGGSYGKKYPVATNVQVVGNTFGTKYYPRCGMYGPQTGFSTSVRNLWSGNVLAGNVIPP